MYFIIFLLYLYTKTKGGVYVKDKKKYLRLLKLRNDLLKDKAKHLGNHQDISWIVKQIDEQLKEIEQKV